jgi:vitamin B12 transporter
MFRITIYKYFLIISLIFLCYTLALAYSQTAYAQSVEEMEILRLFYKEKDLVVSATRYEKPISQVAENITIVTAKEIEEMNAHTLTDVLNIIPGVQMEIRGGTGSATMPYIQGSDYRHVLVLIDGVSLNNLSDNVADIGAIPVQNIERIEIIKGPASSAWGSSLGGVINIITKSVGDSLKPEGAVSLSYGEKDTGDYRADIAGEVGQIGYYLYAGHLHSDGFSPNQEVSANNFYTKLNVDLTEKVSLLLTFGYNKGSRGFGEYPDFALSSNQDFEYLFSTLSLNVVLNDKTDLSFSLRTSRQNTELFFKQLSTGVEIEKDTYDDKTNGGSAKLTWRHGAHVLGIGADYDSGELESNTIISGKQRLEKWAVFVNDTLIFDKWSFTPGIRYDYTSTSDDFVSPSLGITYALGEKSIFRIDVARGFNIPPLMATYGTGFFFKPNPNLEVEKVWSYQAGIESSALKYLCLKTTVFRHDISDAIVSEKLPDGTFTKINKDDIRRQGFEVEIETAPIYNASFSGGFIFQDVKNLETDKTIKDIPEYTYDIGLKYDNKKSFVGLLKGHYIWWNAKSSYSGKYSSFIWDLNLIKKLYKSNDNTAEIFLTAHNIFDGSQYLDKLFKNPGRWIEAGIRVKF